MAGIKAKVAVTKVIAKLEARLEEDAKNIKQNEVNEREWREALLKWQKDFVKDFAKGLEVEGIHYRSYNGSVEVTYRVPAGSVVPEQPERKYDRTLGSYELEEIKNAINILKMTDDEFVSASTFSSISKYL